MEFDLFNQAASFDRTNYEPPAGTPVSNPNTLPYGNWEQAGLTQAPQPVPDQPIRGVSPQGWSEWVNLLDQALNSRQPAPSMRPSAPNPYAVGNMASAALRGDRTGEGWTQIDTGGGTEGGEPFTRLNDFGMGASNTPSRPMPAPAENRADVPSSRNTAGGGYGSARNFTPEQIAGLSQPNPFNQSIRDLAGGQILPAIEAPLTAAVTQHRAWRNPEPSPWPQIINALVTLNREAVARMKK